MLKKLVGEGTRAGGHEGTEDQHPREHAFGRAPALLPSCPSVFDARRRQRLQCQRCLQSACPSPADAVLCALCELCGQKKTAPRSPPV
jgi:hypothetical protein